MQQLVNDNSESSYKRHGGPWDRGSADAYYGRPHAPHYFKGATYQSERVTRNDMSLDEIEAYNDGYYRDNICRVVIFTKNETDRDDW